MAEAFSLLTASYNNAKYLEDWSQSILWQSYRPLEVIFVNDCSTDNTIDSLRHYGNIFSQNNITLKIIDNSSRMYYAGALQVAWSNAAGPFFGVLDSDDQLEKGAIEYVMDLYEKFPHIGYIYSQFAIYDQNLKKWKGHGFSCGPKNEYESLLEVGMRKKHGFSHWRTFCTRVPRLHKIFRPGLRAAVDKYMGYRLEELAPGMFTDKVLYKYRGWVPGCISLTEKPKEVWQTVIKEAKNRRAKYSYKPFPVTIYKG